MGLGFFEEVSVHVFGLGGGFGWNWIGDVGSFFSFSPELMVN
jgi:hypothetical protein